MIEDADEGVEAIEAKEGVGGWVTSEEPDAAAESFGKAEAEAAIEVVVAAVIGGVGVGVGVGAVEVAGIVGEITEGEMVLIFLSRLIICDFMSLTK